jgi:LacI family transcriptional regulator
MRTSSPIERPRGATIRDVAREAGVGIATASRALGARALVKPETRERILAAAERVGYRPSRVAKVLRGAKARLIGVMIPDISLPLYGSWLRGASDAARERDYVLLVCDGQNSIETIEQQLDRLHQEPLDGLAIPGPLQGLPQIERFEALGIPVVPDPRLLATRTRGSRRAQQDAEALRSGPATAFEHLVSLGHRRILYLAHVERDRGVLSAMQRLRIETLRTALVDAGAEWSEDLVVRVDGATVCRTRLRSILEAKDRPTAVVAGTEALTPAVLAAIADVGLEIPANVSVLGFGDSLWEEAYRPPISVVRLDYWTAGRAMMEHLIARIEGDLDIPAPPMFPAEFVERGSCAAPPRERKRRR